MAVYNGARFLPAQLASIAAQADAAWRLIASDDGSTDASLAILADFAAAHPGRVEVVTGPGRGFAANFLSLLARVPAGWRAAFCDQDDVWYADKLSRAAAALAAAPEARATLYAARSMLVDHDLRPRQSSRGLPRPAGFGNALVQNIASGNAMVLNPAAVGLLQAALTEVGAVPLHDWWAYQLVTGAGGGVVFDEVPALDYRQHDANQVGGGRGVGAVGRRGGRLFDGSAARLMAAQAEALAPSAHRLTPGSRRKLDAFRRALASPDRRTRARLLRAAGPWRQSRAGTLLLLALLLARRG